MLLSAAEPAPEILHRFETPVRGAALLRAGVTAWGDGVVEKPLARGAARTLSRARFGEGGCAFDGGLVLHELPAAGGDLGRMVLLHGGRIEAIDNEAHFRDCLAVSLFGRRGVLVVHRQAQVRFYERRQGRWSYREIYSIYTPSHQGGLLIEDVDSDGRPDILCGNYWIRSPARFDLPWRLFAIGDWWESADSAMLRLVPGLIAAQRDASPARIAWFDKSADATQFWTERRVVLDPPARFVRALAAGPGPGEVIAGEDAGPGSRLIRIRRSGEASVIGRGEGFLHAWTIGGDVVTVSRSEIARWRLF